MLQVINPGDDDEHSHGDNENEEMKDEENEEMEDGDEEEETEEQYQARLAEAKVKFKAQMDEVYARKSQGAFKGLFRSKGFLWLSNRPDLFFEMSQAAI